MRVKGRGLGDTSSPKPQNQRIYRGIDKPRLHVIATS